MYTLFQKKLTLFLFLLLLHIEWFQNKLVLNKALMIEKASMKVWDLVKCQMRIF